MSILTKRYEFRSLDNLINILVVFFNSQDGIGNTKDDYYEELRIKNIEENQRFLERVGVLQVCGLGSSEVHSELLHINNYIYL